MVVLLASLPSLQNPPSSWVRVDDPDHPAAIARSAEGSLLAEPPPPGVPWRWASIPEVDGTVGPAGASLGPTGASAWHAAGLTGEGVRVAVFDIGWSADAVDLDRFADVTTHDCFATPTCEVPFDPLSLPSGVGAGPHGWACAEVLRAFAPDAELHLVRVNSLTTLENAVAWAIRREVDIITMSMSFYNDSFYDGTGPHAPLARRLDAADVLMVTSVGNTAGQYWSGPADVALHEPIPVVLDRDTAVYLTWDQFDACGLTDLDVVVLDEDGWVVGSSTDDQQPDADRCEPVERVRALVDHPQTVFLEVRHRRGPTEGVAVQVISRGGRLVEPTVGGTTDPASHPRVVAVGAVPVRSYFSAGAEPFSAGGLTTAGVLKPDLVGPDRLTTRAYGPGAFTGTSASTPAVAGLLALIRSRSPDQSNREAYEHLKAWARTDLGAEASQRLGAGRARLPPPEPTPLGCHTGGGSWPGPTVLWMALWLSARRRTRHWRTR